MSETEEKQEEKQENQEIIVESIEVESDSAPVKEKVWSKFGDDEEPIGEVCNRLLNIFRQMHVLSESGVERFNQDLKAVNEDVKFEFYSVPGGLEIIDYITFLQTGEKINSRRLRARQKQEEELGVDSGIKKEKSQPQTQPVVQQPVIQYVPMPPMSGEGGAGAEAVASMQAMMTQFVSMQQNAGGASFSASELANVLSENQKNIVNAQTKNFIEGQKAITSSQTKSFLDGQKALADLQSKFVIDAQKQMMQIQEKFLSDAKETLERSQKILFAMQKDALEQVTSRIENIASKVSENATPSINYEALLEIQEKTAKYQVEALKEAGKENLLAFERIAESIKSGNVFTSGEVVIKENKREIPDKVKDGSDDEPDSEDDDFAKKIREKRKEKMMKKRLEVNNEDTFEIKETSPTNTVFVSVADDDANNEETVVVSHEEKVLTNKEEDVEKDESVEVMEELTETVNENTENYEENNTSESISEIATGDSDLVDEENYSEEGKEEEFVEKISDFDDVPTPPSFTGDDNEKNDDDMPLDDDNTPSKNEVKENFYNRAEVENMSPQSEAFIPEQGSLKNLPQPGVLTSAQVTRKEGNIGFAINDGSYKQSAKKDPAEAVRNYEEDPFAKRVSPKAVSRFKSKKNIKPDNNSGDKGIFSVFKKFVGNDKKGDSNNNQSTLDEDN